MFLSSAKRTVEFTEAQISVWYAALNRYQSKTINRAAIQLGASEKAFPELADMIRECRRIEPPKHEKTYSPHGTGENSQRLTREEIEHIAECLNLEV